jgi:hypothetical protein
VEEMFFLFLVRGGESELQVLISFFLHIPSRRLLWLFFVWKFDAGAVLNGTAVTVVRVVTVLNGTVVVTMVRWDLSK